MLQLFGKNKKRFRFFIDQKRGKSFLCTNLRVKMYSNNQFTSKNVVQ